MPIRFKFRSSLAFNSVDLGGAASISVRDFRSRIADHKNLRTCGEFDLIISDAHTFEEYKDDESMIPEGSDVVIKRVPATTGVLGVSGNFGTRYPSAFVSLPSENIHMNSFDDFGNDFYPILDVSLPNSDAEASDTSRCNRDENSHPRCFGAYASGYKKEKSDLSEAMSKDNSAKKCHHSWDSREKKKNLKSTSKTENRMKFDGSNDFPSPTLLFPDFPVELKCSLCNLVFKEAVLIPCCQHSFCEKCIRSALTEKSSCPRCASRKCDVGDLLPNVSLRQAIEHFPEVHMASSSDKVVCEYVPDGESGIRGKDVSCASSLHPQEAPLLESPSATWKGSNHVLTETYEPVTKNNGFTVTGSRIIHLYAEKPEKFKMKQKELSNDQFTPGNLKIVASELPPNIPKTEGNLMTKKKKGLFANITDLAGGASSSRQRKGERNCYMCGSPDHLIRDCPVACGQHPMLQTGDMISGGLPPYRQAYWHGNPYAPMRPYFNMYGTSGIIPFNPGIVPVSVPSYMPSFYSGLPVACGFVGMGGISLPMASRAGCPPHAEVMELQECERKQIIRNEHLESKQNLVDDQDDNLVDDYHQSVSPRGSHDYETEMSKGTSKSYSGHCNPRLHKKHSLVKSSYGSSCYQTDHLLDDEMLDAHDHKHEKGTEVFTSKRDQKLHLKESSFDINYLIDTSLQTGKERKKHHHRTSGSRKHDERAEHASYDQKNLRRYYKESGDVEKVSSDRNRVKQSKEQHIHKSSSWDHDSSSHRRHHKKRSRHCSWRSRDQDMSSDDQLVTDGGRWEMVGAHHDGLDKHRYHRRTS